MHNRTIASVNLDAAIKHPSKSYGNADGVRLVFTDGTQLEFGINMVSDCCERFDYLHSDIVPEEFVGAKLLKVEEIDTWPKSISIPASAVRYDNPHEVDCDGGGYQAIRILTTKGEMEFVVYNSHNGYYSHNTLFIFDGEVKESYL